MLCFIQVHLYSIVFFTKWKKFSTGLMSGFLGGIWIIQAPISNAAFFAFKWFWLGPPSWRNNILRGLLLFSKLFSWQSLPKISCQLLFILLTQNCSMTMGNGYKQFHYFTPRALFFFFCGAFQRQTLWFLTLCHYSMH